MRSVADTYKALEEHALGGSAFDVAALADLAGGDLRQTDEHDVATLLVLAALCARLDGGGSAAAELTDVADQYTRSSLLYTGRILPRAKEMIALLDRSTDDRSLDGLVETADHLSQGWPAYGDSVFPAAFDRLAGELGLEPDAGCFSQVSFVLWWQALEAAARNDPHTARPLFERSLERYRRYLYYADAAWIFTDLVAAALLADQQEEAADILDEQRRYVQGVLAEHPAASPGGPHVFHVGDVISGGYSTFVESSSLRPSGFTERDHALLLRFVRASEFLVSAARYRTRKDFEAALDVFSAGRAAFPQSPYPRIFRHLAEACAKGAEAWDVHLTAHERWHQMLRTYRVRVKPHVLIETATALHERLSYAGLAEHAGLVLLDAAVLHAHLHGRSLAVAWITRYLERLRAVVPDALSAVVDHVQAPRGAEEWSLLGRYIGLRTSCLAPELLSVGLAERQSAEPSQLQVSLYGRLLAIEGITVHESTPPPLVDILTVLGDELNRGQAEGTEPPFLSASELAERTGRTGAALAQAVRRFRGACQRTFQEATDWDIVQEAVIQGRPGYRMNPQSVQRFAVYSA
ncbi:hypothetical protein ACX6XY_15340 [Streptomyces sp. O3]